MAILTRCCCFDNARSGSMASAIYTLVYAAISLIYAAWQVAVFATVGLYYSAVFYLYVIQIMGLVLWAFVLLSSILVLVGIQVDQRGYLLPYMIAMPLVILLQSACMILYIYLMVIHAGYGAVIAGYGFIMAVILAFTILDVFCFLTVVSQYQELQAGRGRQVDIINARTHTTTVFSSQAPGGNVVVTQQGGYPQPAGYVVQAPPPGYPAQQGGYPAQQGGYPAQQGGYPPEQAKV